MRQRRGLPLVGRAEEAASGTPTAAATCMAPESFETHARQAPARRPAFQASCGRQVDHARSRSVSGTSSAMRTCRQRIRGAAHERARAPRSVMRVVANSAKCRAASASPSRTPRLAQTRRAAAAVPACPRSSARASSSAAGGIVTRARAVRSECRAHARGAGSRRPDAGCRAGFGTARVRAARAYRRRIPIARESRARRASHAAANEFGSSSATSAPSRAARATSRRSAPSCTAAHATRARRPRRRRAPAEECATDAPRRHDERAPGNLRRTSSIAGSAITASPSQFGARSRHAGPTAVSSRSADILADRGLAQSRHRRCIHSQSSGCSPDVPLEHARCTLREVVNRLGAIAAPAAPPRGLHVDVSYRPRQRQREHRDHRGARAQRQRRQRRRRRRRPPKKST